MLVYHPYERFSDTTVRFFSDAADDPAVVAIRLTLYRVGERSPIVEALTRALDRKKEVALFVELKARFDETRNVGWVRRLEEAGATVVYGVVGLKNHAKVGLVLRREEDGLRQYVHIGTGNYNAATAKVYTDLSLFSADPDLGADVHDLFNQLTGSSRAPAGSFRRIAVAPEGLLPWLLGRIDREIAHAAAGRPARIRAKLNGLADTEVIQALYRASRAGVTVELVVRGLCTLRPGVPGHSDRIRVVSRLGRYLEHARIYHFGNGGEDEFWIGSADWRPRNLRVRVEVVAPVSDAEARATLDAMLTKELVRPGGVGAGLRWRVPAGRRRRERPEKVLSALATEVSADLEFSVPSGDLPAGHTAADDAGTRTHDQGHRRTAGFDRPGARAARGDRAPVGERPGARGLPRLGVPLGGRAVPPARAPARR